MDIHLALHFSIEQAIESKKHWEQLTSRPGCSMLARLSDVNAFLLDTIFLPAEVNFECVCIKVPESSFLRSMGRKPRLFRSSTVQLACSENWNKLRVVTRNTKKFILESYK